MAATDSPITPEVCRTVVVLHEEGGVLKAAAARLGETASAVSRRLIPLREGDPLLPRPWLRKEGKKLLLTPEGLAMLPLATALADTWARLGAEATRPHEPGLTVACGQEAAGGVVLAAATAFRKVHPRTPLRIAVVRGRQRIEGVAAGYYGLALVTTAKRDIESVARRDVAVRSLPDDELVLACAVKSEWEAEFKRVTEVTAARLRDWPLVLPEADAAVRQAWEEKVGRQAVTPPPPAIEVGGWRVLMGYVLAGFGVGLLPTSVVKAANAGKPTLIARPLAGNIRPANQLRVVTRPGGANAALVKTFDDALGPSAGASPGAKQ